MDQSVINSGNGWTFITFLNHLFEWIICIFIIMILIFTFIYFLAKKMENNIKFAIKSCRFVSIIVIVFSFLLLFSSYPSFVRILIFSSNLMWIITTFLPNFPNFHSLPITTVFSVILLVFSNLVWIMFCLSHSISFSLKLFVFIIHIWLLPCLILSIIGIIDDVETNTSNSSYIRDQFDKILHSAENALPPSGNNKEN